MKRLPFEHWHRFEGPLHRLDARSKLITLILFLIAITTTRNWNWAAASFYFLVVLVILLVSRAPSASLLRRGAVILPFAATFAAVSALSGDWLRAWTLLGKSFVSTCAVLVVVATTPLHRLLAAAHQLGVPHLVVTVALFLYRYLFVLAEKADRLRMAAAMRGGFRWSSAGGAIAALFGSAYSHAEGVHRAMLARGATTYLPHTIREAWRFRDTLVVTLSLVVLIGVRLTWLP
ncbi:MAG: hypothetical protein IT168_13705 [Bryobacterales bacterium]|nr:hypothetical protein [Bryobacterales bacterium]